MRAGPRGDGTARGEAAGAGGRQHSGGRRGDEAYCARRAALGAVAIVISPGSHGAVALERGVLRPPLS